MQSAARETGRRLLLKLSSAAYLCTRLAGSSAGSWLSLGAAYPGALPAGVRLVDPAVRLHLRDGDSGGLRAHAAHLSEIDRHRAGLHCTASGELEAHTEMGLVVRLEKSWS